MKTRRASFLVLIFLVSTGHLFAQKRPAIFMVGDDCDNGVATKAVEQAYKEASTISQRWSEGNEKVPNTPVVFIQCWNVDGESFVVTSFGFTVSGGRALFDKPKLYLAHTPEIGHELGILVFKQWEEFWREKAGSELK